MLRRIIKKKNSFLDWFISEKPNISREQLFVQRRFVESILLALAASFVGFLFNVFDIWTNFPSGLTALMCIGVLVLYRLSSNNILSGNTFIGFIMALLVYDIVTSPNEIITSFRWFAIIPVFSLLVINKNSTVFWSVVIIAAASILFFFEYPETSVLSNTDFKLFFILDTLVYYVFLLILIYIYYIGKEVINKQLDKEREEIKKKAKDLELVQNQLLEKNRDLQTYAHVVSHDLKAPLRGILGFSEILKENLAKEDCLKEESEVHLNFIKNNAIQMEELITDILRYAELSNNKTKEFKSGDINVLLEQAIKTFPHDSIENAIEINKLKLPEIPLMPTQVRQIFQNLIANSVKFADNNRPLKIVIHEENQDDYIKLTFEDNGIGVKEENLEYIFLPFRRLNSHSKYNGSGIGLANCAKVIRRHNGKIWAESEFGKSLKISLLFPKKR